MKLIQITDHNDCIYMVNIYHIIYLSKLDNSTLIQLTNGLKITTNLPYIQLAERIYAMKSDTEQTNFLYD